MDFVKLLNQFKDATFRNKDHTSLFEKLCADLGDRDTQSAEDQEVVTDIFRALRNSCIGCQQNQNILVKTSIPNYAVNVLTSSHSDLPNCNMRSCILQFLGNFVAGNTETQRCLWKMTFPTFFKHFFGEVSMPQNHVAICSMIFYNCLHNSMNLGDLFSCPEGEEVVVLLCNCLSKLPNDDWIILCINDHFFKIPRFLPTMLFSCPKSTQGNVLELYCDWISSSGNYDETKYESSAMKCLAERFVETHKASKNHSEPDGELFLVLLKALCWASAVPGCWSEGVEIMQLVDCVIELLRGVNEVCESDKDRDNAVRKIPSLYQFLAPSSGKRDLIRLLGNLCFENHRVQEEIRALGGISLVLEACNIDDDNPFMQQWAVFTIRNLCQKNPLNQSEIAKLEKLGITDSPILNSMGLTAVLDQNGKVKVMPK